MHLSRFPRPATIRAALRPLGILAVLVACWATAPAPSRSASRSAGRYDPPSEHNVAAAFDQTLQTLATTDGNGTVMNIGGLTGLSVQIPKTGPGSTFGTATVTFEMTVNGANWEAVTGYPVLAGSGVTTTTSGGTWQINVTGGDRFRARISGSGGGTSLTITAKALPNGFPGAGGAGGGGGGGGGGAATIADGADITQGQLSDAAVGDAGGTVNAHLRQIAKLLNAALATTTADGSNVTLGSLADAAVGDASGTSNSHLRQIAKLLAAALATTTVDGGNVTLGSLADAAVGDASGTANSHLRQIAKLLAAALATTAADGSNVTLGALADAAVGDATGTANSHLRQIAKLLAAALATTTVDGGNVALGALADAAVGDASGTANSHLRQIAKTLGSTVTVNQSTASNLKAQIASTATPAWTDSVSIISAQTLAINTRARGTWDLRTAKGGYAFIRLGRGGTTAITPIGPEVLIRRVIGNGAAGGIHPAGTTLVGGITLANNTTVAVDSASGQNTLNATAGTGFAADQIICIQDSGGGVTRLEWARISRVVTNTITLDSPLTYTHTAVQADTIRNQADAFTPVWLDGGSLYEVIIDYGQQTAGDTLTVQALGQAYASDTYQ